MILLRYLLPAVLLLISIPAVGQQSYDFKNFDGLKQKGALPQDVTTSWVEKYNARLKEMELKDLSRSEEKEWEEFWGRQQFGLGEMLQSGYFSFGDPLSQYLQDIKDTLLHAHPDLKEEVRVYLYKGPSVNAFSLADGIVGINVGLIAHAKTEAEIAFVIAHEIAHYTKKHSINRYRQVESMKNSGGLFSSSLSPLTKVNRYLQRSKEHELEADYEGYQIYKESVYSPAAIDSAFTMLHQSYITFGRAPVGDDFLAVGDDNLPETFFRAEITPISKEENYFDETHTHPNIFVRRTSLAVQLEEYEEAKKEIFAFGRRRFEQLRNMARFEMIREKIVNLNYGEALYDIYVMQQQFPNNRFLELSKVRALYGLASIKSIDKVSKVLSSTYEVEGPSQQVFHLLKRFNCNQMNSLALKHVRKAQEKYPEAEFLNGYANSIAKYLKIYCDATIYDFQTEQKSLPPFGKTEADFDSKRRYIRARQRYYDDFHKNLLYEEVQSGWLQEQLEKYQPVKDSLDREFQLSADYREERREKRIEKWDTEGMDLEIQSMAVLDPRLVMETKEKDASDLVDAMKEEKEFRQIFFELAGEQGIQTQPLFTTNMNSEDIALYEQYARLKEWIYEARFFRYLKLDPVHRDVIKALKLPSRYVCQVEGILNEDSDDYYFFGIYDLQKGKLVYAYANDRGKNLKPREVEKETEKQLFRINN